MDPPTEAFPRTLVITGALARGDIPGLCHRARQILLGSERRFPLVCDVGALAACDAVILDALAHLKLIARRHGSQMRVVGASGELAELIDLVGLSEALDVARA